MHKSTMTWLIGFTLATLLSVAGPGLYFNRATPLILGMPPLGVYAVDRATGGIGNDVEEPR